MTVAAVKAAPVWLQSSPALLWSSPLHLSMSPPPQHAPPPSASAPPPLPQMKVVLLFLRAPSSPMMACLSWPSPKPPRSSSGGRPRSEDRSSGGAFQSKRCSRGDGRWCVCVCVISGDSGERSPGGGAGRGQQRLLDLPSGGSGSADRPWT